MRQSRVWLLVALLAVVAVAAVVIWSARSRVLEERAAARQPLRPIPAEQDRGEVPLAGYSIQGYSQIGEAEVARVHLWSPYYFDMTGDEYSPCQVVSRMRKGEDGGVRFIAHLVWGPLSVGDMRRDGECQVEKLKHDAPKDITEDAHSDTSYDILERDLARLTMDGPVIRCVKVNKTASCAGSVPTVARSDNALPELDDAGAPK